MNQLGLVHPELLTHLGSNVYPATCAIQQSTSTPDSYGEPTLSWAAVTGMTAIPCRVAPQYVLRQETEQPQYTITEPIYAIALAGSYPTITTAMRAVVGSVTYNIMAIEHDGNSETTWLRGEVVTL